MKCPVCWSDKAYRHPVKGWKDALMSCLFMVPFQCRHCFHSFYVPWPLTLGKVVTPPVARKSSHRSDKTFRPRGHAATHGHACGGIPRRRGSLTCDEARPGTDSSRLD